MADDNVKSGTRFRLPSLSPASSSATRVGRRELGRTKRARGCLAAIDLRGLLAAGREALPEAWPLTTQRERIDNAYNETKVPMMKRRRGLPGRSPLDAPRRLASTG